jgi:TolB protein
VHTSEKNLRMTAHRIADVIFERLIGIRGAFATRIAYVTVQGKAKEKVYRLELADSDGFNPRALIESTFPIMSPAWSPDGRRLAYVSFEEGAPAVYVQEVFSGQRRKVATGATGGTNSSPAWAPDGRSLAITRSVDGNPDIYVLDLTSGQTRRLTEDAAIDTEASFAPDGKSLIFTSDRGGSPQIYKVPVGGGKATRLTVSQGNYNAKASISADGKLMVMVHGGDGGFHIAVMELASGKFSDLTDARLDEAPSFAPNGAMIIYTTSSRRGTDLASISADGRIQNHLETTQGEVREPAWGPIIGHE